MKSAFARQWLPSVIFAGLGLIFTLIYTFVFSGAQATVYLQIVLGIAGLFIFPVWGAIVKKPFAPALSIIVGLLVFFGIYLGKASDMYSYIPHYDKVLHTNFGLVGAGMVYALLMRWHGDKLNPAGLIVIVILATLGMGAVWEFIEFYGGMLTGEDPQLVWGAVNEIINAGGERVINPITDTIDDMLVTVMGSAVFIILYLLDKAFGGKVFKKLFEEEPRKLNVK